MIWLIIYLIGCLIALLLSIYSIRYHGKCTLQDVFIAIVMILLSYISIMGFCFVVGENFVLWRKK